MEKTCKACGAVKTRYGAKNTLRCKPCSNASALAHQAAHPERAREVVRNWDAKNPGKRAAQNKAWLAANPERVKASKKAWREANPDKVLAQSKRHRLKRYGLTPAQFDAMLVAQNSGCAVCAGPPSGMGTFHVDHDHETGIVRGLLCHGCNAALGMVKDSVEVLRKLIEYLARHGMRVAV